MLVFNNDVKVPSRVFDVLNKSVRIIYTFKRIF